MNLFGKIAVASTFSPRFLPMLAEARALAGLLGTDFEIIHAGVGTRENHDRFKEAFDTLGLTARVHWHEADQPSTAIIQAARNAGTGLLLAGAMERDSEGRHFLGKVARVLIHDAPCSLLLYTHPARETTPFRKLAVVVDYSPASRIAIEATLELARKCKAEEIHVLRVYTVFAQVFAQPDTILNGRDRGALAAEEARLDAFVQEFELGDLTINTRCIEGTTGFAAAEFVESIEADLLIVGCESKDGHATIPARMEWLGNTIPTNLLLLHPQVS